MADWRRLTSRLEASGAPRLELSFSEIERIIGSPLPASSRYAAFWSNSSSYAAAWKRAGYAATRRGVLAGHMGFVRTVTPKPSDPAGATQSRSVLGEGSVSPAAEPSDTVRAVQSSSRGDAEKGGPDIVLVGCVKTKADHASPARDLYRSPMFDRRRRYAEATGRPWYILSAEHGLLDPGSLVEPYDVYLADESDDYRRAWGEWVAARLTRLFGSLHGHRIEVHASAAYVEAIESPLRRSGAVVISPLAGLRQGEQLSWYDQPAVTDQPAGTDQVVETSQPEQPVAALAQDLVILDGPHPIGSFSFRWPESTEEEFDRGWDLMVEVDGRRRRVRHGLGTRQVYGMRRRHSVTFIDGWAVAEGVAPDNYERTKSLISVLKGRDGKLVRPGDTVPAPYVDFPMVSHAEQILAPYTRDALAVRLHEDDITSWVGYALARLAVRGAAAKGPSSPPPNPAPPTSAPSHTTQLAVHTPASAAIVQALLDYGQTQAPETVGRPTFTPHPDANLLIWTNPFAFLLAVVFDQGIPAERAWRAPYELMQRLGHLDPERMLADPDGVRVAVAQPPMLHRYRDKMPGWLLAAARIVLQEYGGDAARIWNDEPLARELQRRLDRFPGIGQKKAAMAVEILERDLGVPVRELSGSDIAYDVHVRRVFLRTGLAQYDDLAHMVDVARRANPERPGAIDSPAWLVGRQWCHAGLPDCAACVLRHVCPKDIGRANAVRGA